MQPIFDKIKNIDTILINIIYQKPLKETDWIDYLHIIYKNIKTKKSEIITIKNPMMELYTVKQEYRVFTKPRLFLPEEHLDKIVIPYNNIQKEIANIAGGDWKKFYYNHLKTDRKEAKKIMKYPYCLGGDIPIETYYRVLWENTMGEPKSYIPTTFALDIKINTAHFALDTIPKNGECEISIASVTDPITKICHILLYDNNTNPQIKEFVKNQKNFQKELHEKFDDSFKDFEYRVYLYQSEITMLEQLFALIHSLEYDFCLLWDIHDIFYIVCRIRKLGYSPEEIICNKRFPQPSLYFYEETNSSVEIGKRRDYFELSDVTQYLYQQNIYTCFKKAKNNIRYTDLCSIAQEEINNENLDYSDIGHNRNILYHNYKLAVIQSIKNGLFQIKIDSITHDTDNLFLSTQLNYVSSKDVLKQTVTLRALLYHYFKLNHLILGHNCNYDLVEKTIEGQNNSSYEGALNAPPELNIENGLILYGKPSKYLYGYTIDFDFSSIYANSIVAFNIFITSLIGKLYVEKDIENIYADEIDTGKLYIEDIITDDIWHIGHRWHNLPNLEDIDKQIREAYDL